MFSRTTPVVDRSMERRMETDENRAELNDPTAVTAIANASEY